MDRWARLPPVWGTGGKVTLAAHRDHGTERVRVLSHSWLSLPVLTGPQTTRGVPQLAPEGFKCVGSPQEPESSKCFLQEPQGAKGGEGKGRGGNAALGPLPPKCPLPTWLFCVQHFISLAHRQSPLQTLLPGSFTDNIATANSPACPQRPAWLCHEAGVRGGGGGGREDALQEQETFQHPHPKAKAKPYLAAARCSLQQAGRLGELRSAGNMNLPPATNFTENKLSPCRTEQLGLGMWAWSRPGLRRGERGCIAGGGACQRHNLPSSSPAQEERNRISGCQKGLYTAPPAPPATAVSPSRSPLF